MKKLIAVLLALSCMLIGAAAVAETLNIAYMPNYGSLWSVETAINKGYFEEEGLTINLVEFADGPTIIAAMESGSIDMGYIGQGAHKLCINGRASIFALSHISNGDALIGGKGITTVEDLKGKVVAYSSGTSSEDILKNSLDKAGMTMDDIKAMDMDASAIVTAMLSGGVDACATWSPNSLKILEEMPDATKLTDNMTFADTTVSLASWICMPKYGEENHDLLVRFTRALFKGMDYSANEHYDEVSEWVSKQTATDYESVYNQRGDAQWLTGKEVAQGAADGTVAKYYELQQLREGWRGGEGSGAGRFRVRALRRDDRGRQVIPGSENKTESLALGHPSAGRPNAFWHMGDGGRPPARGPQLNGRAFKEDFRKKRRTLSDRRNRRRIIPCCLCSSCCCLSRPFLCC